MNYLEIGIVMLKQAAENMELAEEDRTESARLIPIMEDYRARGAEDGPLAAWWAEWPKARKVLEALSEDTDESEGKSEMDAEALKSLLIRRLDEGATDDAILSELRESVPPAVLSTWRSMLLFATAPMVAGALGLPERHHARMDSLLGKLKAQ